LSPNRKLTKRKVGEERGGGKGREEEIKIEIVVSEIGDQDIESSYLWGGKGIGN